MVFISYIIYNLQQDSTEKLKQTKIKKGLIVNTSNLKTIQTPT